MLNKLVKDFLDTILMINSDYQAASFICYIVKQSVTMCKSKISGYDHVRNCQHSSQKLANSWLGKHWKKSWRAVVIKVDLEKSSMSSNGESE